MNYFLDTEFIERPNTIELISIGIVDEAGKNFYELNSECNLYKIWKDKWLRTNVLIQIYDDYVLKLNKILPFSKETMIEIFDTFGKTIKQIKGGILKFVDDSPQFYGYYCDYDWVIFCWIYGRMIDLPKHFPMYCIDLKQMMIERNLDSVWKEANCPDPIGKHSALEDAKWNLKLFKKIRMHDYSFSF